MITGSQRLRDAERKAKQSKAGIWHNYVPPASAGVKLSDDFIGTVVEVVSGDVVSVKDSASGTERRVTLSSIKAPRMGARDRTGEPLSREAREFLRQRLIGELLPKSYIRFFGQLLMIIKVHAVSDSGIQVLEPCF